MSDLLQRLKDRKLVQWALAYAAAAFALLQGADIVAQRFAWPDVIERGLIVVLAMGLFVTLVLAWYHGEKGAQRVGGTELLFLALLLAIGGGLLWRVSPGEHEAITGAAGPPTRSATPVGVTSAIPDKSIAVLPFENLSDEKANAYFADGMQDEILTRLASIADLKVISRTSTERYKSKPDNLKSVAAELGAAHVLEGSVQKSGDSVRINVQLIDARNDAHLWAQTFDRELKNVFVVESEVAQQIADVLKARMSPEETRAVAKASTRNAAAYDVFLKAESQARNGQNHWDEAELRAAEQSYRRAIELDPAFALALSRLAYNQMFRHWFIRNFSAAELAEVKATVDRALSLRPDLPEAHLALGYYLYWGFRSYDEAMQALQRTLQLAPSNYDALGAIGFIHRRRGEWPETLAALEKALTISPQSSSLLGEYGATFMILRRYAEAREQMTRSLAINPEDANYQALLYAVNLIGFGDAKAALSVVDPAADRRLNIAKIIQGDAMVVIGRRAYAFTFERRFDEALHEWDGAPDDTLEQRLAQRVARVAIRVIAGQRPAAQAECTEVRPLIDAQLARDSDSLNLLEQSSWIDVCLGRNAEAMATARRASDLMPVGKDAYFGPYVLSGQAQIATHAGAYDEALGLIDWLMSMPAGEVMTLERLKRDPIWDPLRKDRRFDELLTRYARGGAHG